MGDIRALADLITVLREGAVAGTVGAATPTEELITLMFGSEGLAAEREMASHRTAADIGSTVLRLARVSTAKLRHVSLEIRAGEILGVAGGLGSGRSELVRAIGGIKNLTEGHMELDGAAYRPRSPREAINRGIAVVPEDRDANGVLPGLSLARNATISSLGKIQRGFTPFMDAGAERNVVAGLIERFSIKGRAHDDVMTLSGGNRQKMLLGRATLVEPRVLLLDDPTSGLDIASRVGMGRAVQDFVAAGGAAIVTSDEFDELLRLCTRLAVMRDGRVVEDLVVTGDLTERDVANIAYADEAERVVTA
jgi:ABC-type sugar transport system ATPase subunit